MPDNRRDEDRPYRPRPVESQSDAERHDPIPLKNEPPPERSEEPTPPAERPGYIQPKYEKEETSRTTVERDFQAESPPLAERRAPARSVAKSEGQVAREQRLAAIARVKQIVFFIASAIAIILLLRFILLAAGANLQNPFAAFVMNMSSPLAAPFLNLFPREGAPQAGIIEWSTLIAIAVYYLIAWIIARVIELALTPLRTAH